MQTANPLELLQRLGGSTPSRLGIELAAGESERTRWLWAACLLGGRVSEPVLGRALQALGNMGVCQPTKLAATGAPALAEALEAAGVRRAEREASKLLRAATALSNDFEGSLERLAAVSDGLEDLGSRLVRLTPGFGTGSVLRFLRPLRDGWPAAAEVPMAPSAVAAAAHLGWLADDTDCETAMHMLRANLRHHDPLPELGELEGALEQLGERACLRGRPARCPLGEDCPARS